MIESRLAARLEEANQSESVSHFHVAMGGPLGESGEHRVLNVAVHFQRIQLGIV